ncbi:MAG: hypothetical protein ABW166_18745 [Sedimenticola sp.]
MKKNKKDKAGFCLYHFGWLFRLVFCLMTGVSAVTAEPTMQCKPINGVLESGNYFFGNLCKSMHDPYGNKPYVLYPYVYPNNNRNTIRGAVQVTPGNVLQGRRINIE